MEDLVRRVVGDVADDVKRRLIRDLADLGRDYVAPKVADTVSRTVIKSLDAVVGVAVRNLSENDARRLSGEYLSEVQDQLSQFADALVEYLPYQVAVEVAKKTHGKNSAEANAARLERAAFIVNARSEVRDVFKAVAGDEPED